MDRSDLDKINTFTRREFSDNEVYVFPVTLCDNDIDRDGECFSDSALEQLRKLYIGKTGIFDHDPTASKQSARIYDTEVITDSFRLTKDGRVYKYLRAMAYMVRTDENKSLIAEIDAGIKKEVSVGCSVSKRICSVCGTDINEKCCEHIKGHEYGSSVCHYILEDVNDVYEWSFVAVPAQINAGVTKKYSPKKEEKSMGNEFTPITTQAELDAAVQSRVAEAVAETEKRFEGWISPEAAAVIAKERDDSNAAVADLTTKNKSCELAVLKMRAASEKGLPYELADNLSGETEEEINKDAEKFAKYFTGPKYKPTPKYSGESAFADSKNAAQLEMLRELNNN